MPIDSLKLCMLESVDPAVEFIGEFITHSEVGLSMVHHLILEIKRARHSHYFVGNSGISIFLDGL